MPAQLSYYAAAAHVIPVLALVLAVEMRVFDLHVVPPGKHAATATTRVFTFVAPVLIGTAIVLGEVAALQVLFTNQPTEAASDLVRNALVFSAILFGATQLLALRRLIDPLTKRKTRSRGEPCCSSPPTSGQRGWRSSDRWTGGGQRPSLVPEEPGPRAGRLIRRPVDAPVAKPSAVSGPYSS